MSQPYGLPHPTIYQECKLKPDSTTRFSKLATLSSKLMRKAQIEQMEPENIEQHKVMQVNTGYYKIVRAQDILWVYSSIFVAI